MPNIPFIQQAHNRATPSFRRTKQAFESKDSAASLLGVKRRIDRRKNKDRRHKQINVLFDRRQRIMCRRKSSYIPASNTSLSAKIGKHINTRV